jgi:hypothetical protein
MYKVHLEHNIPRHFHVIYLILGLDSFFTWIYLVI